MDAERAAVACDIVVPVHNALACVRDCLWSLVRCSGDVAHHMHVIDDASDSTTHAFLAAQADAHPQMSVTRVDSAQGFVRSCNLGIRQGTAPYVILVNSDVIVTPGWLGRLIRCAESDPRIASVNPLTNRASHLEIPLAPGASFYAMDDYLARHSARRYPDVVTGVGFCLLLRRSVLEEVGLFDEAYGSGYCEDSDLCMRLTARGHRTVVADDVYVYHKGRGSFPDRDARYRANRKIFDARWLAEYRRQFAAFRAADPLAPARQLFHVPERWDPEPALRETYRRMRRAWRERRAAGLAREAVRGARRLPRATSPVVTPSGVSRFGRSGRLRVTYMLNALTVAGGVLSVVQLVNELILLGVDARIVTTRAYPEVYDWRFLTQPIVFRSAAELVEQFPESDVAVATHWTTASAVAQVVASGRARQAVYFLQDYESWFFPEEDHEARERVRRTYELIPHKIVKSEWLRAMLGRDGFDAHKIPLGMDLGVFYRRELPRQPAPVVLAMTRPRTPNRGFAHVVDALARVKAARPDVEIVLFGDDRVSRRIPFPHRNAGIVSDQNRLAELYSTAAVFLEGSDFQGFGRTTLEAMACGVACVATNVGGVSEYARQRDNCLLVPPRRPDRAAEAILELVDDDGLRTMVQQAGLRTAARFCHRREARDTLTYFQTVAGDGETTPHLEAPPAP